MNTKYVALFLAPLLHLTVLLPGHGQGSSPMASTAMTEEAAAATEDAAATEEVSPKPLEVLTSSAEPFFYRNEAGERAGLEYEIVKSFADAQGYELKFTPVDSFVDVLGRLKKGEGDLAAAVLTITEDRLKYIDFSEPYFPALTLLVERSGQESSSLEDLKGKRIVVRRHSSNEPLIRAIEGVEVVYANNLKESFEMIMENEADGLSTDSGLYLWIAEKYPELAPTLTLTQRDFYGFAMPKGSSLKPELDLHIQSLKESGKYRELLHRSFGKWGVESIDEMAEGLFDTSP